MQAKKCSQIGDYQLEKSLGSGANAKVKLGNKDGQRFAVKILKKATNKELQDIQHEIHMLKDLNHPNIVNLIEAGQGEYVKKSGKSESKYYLVMELAEGGELFEYVANTGAFSNKVCRFYFLQMLDALAHAYSKGICHRDLKPENILYDLNKNLKIADFGFATLIKGKQGDGYLHTVLGTESYMAPEIHNKQPYKGESVDLFAASIILFIMYAGTPPFSKAQQNDPYYKLLTTGQTDKFWNAHARFKPQGYYSFEFIDFMNRALAFDPNKRMSLQEMLQHPYLQQEVSTVEEIQLEFTKRQMIVMDQLEKERIKKQQERLQNKQQQQRGIIAFRGLTEEQLQMFPGLESNYPQLKLERQIKKINQDQIKQFDIVTSQDPELVLRYLLTYFDEQQQEVKLQDTKYKLNCGFVEKVNDEFNNTELDIQIFQVDDDVNVVHFDRKNGDTIKYFEIVKNVQSYINNKLEQQ